MSAFILRWRSREFGEELELERDGFLELLERMGLWWQPVPGARLTMWVAEGDFHPWRDALERLGTADPRLLLGSSAKFPSRLAP